MIFQLIRNIINFFFTSRILVTLFKYYFKWRTIVIEEKDTILKKGFQIDSLKRLGKVIEIPEKHLDSLQYIDENRHDVLIEKMRIDTISSFLTRD